LPIVSQFLKNEKGFGEFSEMNVERHRYFMERL
jgi:hypothetical protein